MGRKIGARIIQVCEALERVGPCQVGVVLVEVGGDATKPHTSRYLLRAVEHGLAIVDKPVVNRWVYQVVPNWREKLGKKIRTSKEAMKQERESSSPKAEPVKQASNVVTLTNWMTVGNRYPGVIERKTKKGANDNKH